MKFDQKTTITYRPPEIVDLKADIWMLGCILFSLAFYKHPFQECTTLSIVNASYYMPSNHNYTEKFENLIRNLLTPDPSLRWNIDELIDILDRWDSIPSIPLNKQALSVKQEQMKRQTIWNEDAWKQLGNKTPSDISDLSARLKNQSPDKGFGGQNVAADFSDFDIGNLKKYHAQKKPNPLNPMGFMNTDFSNSHQHQLNKGFDDFFNFDMGQATPAHSVNSASMATQYSGSTPVDAFSNFEFTPAVGHQVKNSHAEDDFFNNAQSHNARPPQPNSQANFWDNFGGQNTQHNLPEHKAQDNSKKLNGFLELSLDPNEKPEPEPTPAQQPQVSPEPVHAQPEKKKDANSFLDIELH